MAPSGARRHRGGWALVWLLGALAWASAGPILVASTEAQCNSIDNIFGEMLQNGSQALAPAIVRLAAGCNILVKTFICTPIMRDMVVDGAANGQASTWNLDMDVFQFVIETGVTVTLQNMALTRALVFPSADTKLLQPAIFHIRSGARLVLRNVTMQTLCTTTKYYSQALGFSHQPASPSSSSSFHEAELATAAAVAGDPQWVFVEGMSAGAMTLQAVNLTCDPQLDITGPVDLYVHSAPMLAAFAGAANELTLPVTIRLAENITLPYNRPQYTSDKPNIRAPIISYNITISGGVDDDTLTYIDANYTAAWLYVQPPATVTLRGLVITRLLATVWAQNGIVSGLLAGALPITMIAMSPISGASPTTATPPRMFQDLTLIVPQYEVTQLSYWCRMLNVVQPEFSSAADFLRSRVWAAECDTLGGTGVLLRRVSTSFSLYENVRLTSVGFPGVPYDPPMPAPGDTGSYQHVNPPLSLASTAAEWFDGVTGISPQAQLANASRPPASGAASMTDLPILVLLNGTVALSAGDVAVVGGGQRTVRGSVVVTSMCGRCGPQGACATLDFGNLVDAVRLEGASTMVLFQRLTLRNVGAMLTQQLAGSVPAGRAVRDFFQFDRTSEARIFLHEVTVELSLEAFSALSRAMTPETRPSNIKVLDMNASLIQLATFQVSGARGAFVNFSLQGYAGGEVPYLDGAKERDSGSGSSNTAAIVGGCVGGGVGLLLLLLALGFWAQRRRSKSRSAAPKEAKDAEAAAAGAKLDLKLFSGPSGADADGADFGEDTPVAKLVGADSTDGAPVAAAPVAAAPIAAAACGRGGLIDEESPQCTSCTIGTVSVLTSSEVMLAPPPPNISMATQQSLAGCPMGALAPPTGAPPLPHLPCLVGPAPRKAFSLARSVPEDDPLEEPGPSLISGSGLDGHGTAGSVGSGSAAAGRRCLLEPQGISCFGGSHSGQRCLLDPHSMGLAAEQSSSGPSPQQPGSFGGCIDAGGEGGGRAPRILPQLLDPSTSSKSSSEVPPGAASAGAGIGVGVGSVVAGSGLSGMIVMGGTGSSSSRPMSRALSGSRTHMAALALGEPMGFGAGASSGPRAPSLRVRALGRSPSRPSRSFANSSSDGPSTTLPAPQPVVLASDDFSGGQAPGPGAAAPLSGSVAGGRSAAGTGAGAAAGHGLGFKAAGPSSGSSAMGSTARLRSGRVPHLCVSRSPNPFGAAGGAASPGGGGGGGGQQRREMTAQPALVGSELCDPNTTASHSTQFVVTAGTLDHISRNFDADSSSPGVSMSISKMPEPASEVARLILELSAQGTDQLVILEPIGQGGYGTVYRGVWRNLDVAVKTVLFQDRANFTPVPSPPLGFVTTSLPQSHVTRTGITTEQRIEEQEPSTSRPGSAASAPRPCLSFLTAAPAPGTPTCGPASVGQPCSAGLSTAATCGHSQGPGTATPTSTGTHNWALASQQAANSGSLPTVNVGAAAPGQGPPGFASQQRAVLEAAVSCSVTHPNVVATYHYDITAVRPSGVVCSGGLLINDGHPRGAAGAVGGIVDWKLYLVQEFCDGGSLAGALDNRLFHDINSMPNLAMTLCTLADIARGMAHIHSRSIVHGDLNPTNILLRSAHGSNGGIISMWNRVGSTSSGQGGGGGGGGSGSATPGACAISHAASLRQELGVSKVAKVADFGLCGMLAPGKRHISNAQRGTPFYTAPETVETGTLTKASDVYSFGVIAWEVYTGRPPFQHVADHGFVRDTSFPLMPRHAPATFANITMACLSSDPERRPTFQQILDRLMALQCKLATSLQLRLSRLVANQGVILGTGGIASPP